MMEKGNEAVTHAEEFTKAYGELVALDGIRFDVWEGGLFGFLGPNGAGKTTMIRILTGLFRPTAGKVFASGRDARTKSVQAENWSVIVPNKSWKGS